MHPLQLLILRDHVRRVEVIDIIIVDVNRHLLLRVHLLHIVVITPSIERLQAEVRYEAFSSVFKPLRLRVYYYFYWRSHLLDFLLKNGRLEYVYGHVLLSYFLFLRGNQFLNNLLFLRLRVLPLWLIFNIFLYIP